MSLAGCVRVPRPEGGVELEVVHLPILVAGERRVTGELRSTDKIHRTFVAHQLDLCGDIAM
jgi:hypothetical protein